MLRPLRRRLVLVQDGVWVVDASVLPTCPEVNPQVSIMAMAEAIADGVDGALRQRLDDPPMLTIDDERPSPTFEEIAVENRQLFPRDRRNLYITAAIGVLAAVLYTWGLSSMGWANSYYAAAVRAGTKSWKAFFFGAIDPGSFITVDKPPAAFWVQTLSARVFGFSSCGEQALKARGSFGKSSRHRGRLWLAVIGLVGLVVADQLWASIPAPRDREREH